MTTYTISPALAPGLCLAPSNSTNGATLVLADCSDNTTVFRHNTKNGKVRNMDSGLCVDVTDGVFSNGTLAQVWGCYSCNTHQAFDFIAQSNTTDTNGTVTADVLGNYTIQWASTDYCLDLINGTAQVGAEVQVWKCLDYNDNQKWTLDEVVEVDETEDDGALDTYNAALAAAQNAARVAASTSAVKRHIYRGAHHGRSHH